MSNVSSWARTGLLAVLLAMVGFSYSLATNSNSTPDVEGRAAGATVGSFSPLAFANPFVTGTAGDRDLGDAVSGSAVVRLVRAKGGCPPYAFTAGSVPAGLTLFKSGLVAGTLGSFTTFPNLQRFAVTVKDSFGNCPA